MSFPKKNELKALVRVNDKTRVFEVLDIIEEKIRKEFPTVISFQCSFEVDNKEIRDKVVKEIREIDNDYSVHWNYTDKDGWIIVIC